MKRSSQLISVVVDKKLWKPIQLGKKGPKKLSHLTFANDLILFAEATMDQVNVASSCFDFFCGTLGGKVSNDKTRVFFSQNVNWRMKEEISNSMGFQLIDNHGKYLGINLHRKSLY